MSLKSHTGSITLSLPINPIQPEKLFRKGGFSMPEVGVGDTAPGRDCYSCDPAGMQSNRKEPQRH